ncbi:MULTISPECIES: hypothetical protein [Leclercia]|uniref:hypothetical protein n=1 Tax=Leclercia sp. CFBP8987 TaxID=3096525 RepID=UPI003BB8927A
MNRRFPLSQFCLSGRNMLPAIRISNLQTCRCYTHLGASQDSRAGTTLCEV